MIFTCLVVGGTMAFILTWFLKKLNKIEVDFWGDKAEQVGGVPLHKDSDKEKGKKKKKQ